MSIIRTILEESGKRWMSVSLSRNSSVKFLETEWADDLDILLRKAQDDVRVFYDGGGIPRLPATPGTKLIVMVGNPTRVKYPTIEDFLQFKSVDDIGPGWRTA